MKQLFTLILFILISLPIFAQNNQLPVDPISGKASYTDIVEVQNKKNALFKNAQTWITKSFGDYKAVIQFEDKDNGKLILKGFSRYETFFADKLNYTITIDCKDNKYRCVVSDIHQGSTRFPSDRIPIERTTVSIGERAKKLEKINIDIKNTTKKSTIKKLEEEKAKDEEFLNLDKSLIDFTDKTIKDLLSSLKQSMSIKDDF